MSDYSESNGEWQRLEDDFSDDVIVVKSDKEYAEERLAACLVKLEEEREVSHKLRVEIERLQTEKLATVERHREIMAEVDKNIKSLYENMEKEARKNAEVSEQLKKEERVRREMETVATESKGTIDRLNEEILQFKEEIGKYEGEHANGKEANDETATGEQESFQNLPVYSVWMNMWLSWLSSNHNHLRSVATDLFKKIIELEGEREKSATHCDRTFFAKSIKKMEDLFHDVRVDSENRHTKYLRSIKNVTDQFEKMNEKRKEVARRGLEKKTNHVENRQKEEKKTEEVPNETWKYKADQITSCGDKLVGTYTNVSEAIEELHPIRIRISKMAQIGPKTTYFYREQREYSDGRVDEVKWNTESFPIIGAAAATECNDGIKVIHNDVTFHYVIVSNSTRKGMDLTVEKDGKEHVSLYAKI